MLMNTVVGEKHLWMENLVAVFIEVVLDFSWVEEEINSEQQHQYFKRQWLSPCLLLSVILWWMWLLCLLCSGIFAFKNEVMDPCLIGGYSTVQIVIVFPLMLMIQNCWNFNCHQLLLRWQLASVMHCNFTGFHVIMEHDVSTANTGGKFAFLFTYHNTSLTPYALCNPHDCHIIEVLTLFCAILL